MNYYTDGTEGAPSVLFEINGVGLMAWILWDHARFIEDPAEREAYAEAVYPSIRLAAEAIERCRDPVTGLECPYFSEGNSLKIASSSSSRRQRQRSRSSGLSPMASPASMA